MPFEVPARNHTAGIFLRIRRGGGAGGVTLMHVVESTKLGILRATGDAVTIGVGGGGAVMTVVKVVPVRVDADVVTDLRKKCLNIAIRTLTWEYHLHERGRMTDLFLISPLVVSTS